METLSRLEASEFVNQLWYELRGPERAAIAGQWRNGSPTISELVVLIMREEGTAGWRPPASMDVAKRTRMGLHGTLFVNERVLPLSIWLCDAAAWAAMLLRLTGPEGFWQHLQREAARTGHTLSATGLTRDGERVIGLEEQDVFTILGTPWVKPADRHEWTSTSLEMWRVPSSRNDGTFYALTRVDGQLSCSCKGFTYRGTCRHVKEAQRV